jgi:hypothetical protein
MNETWNFNRLGFVQSEIDAQVFFLGVLNAQCAIHSRFYLTGH